MFNGRKLGHQEKIQTQRCCLDDMAKEHSGIVVTKQAEGPVTGLVAVLRLQLA